MKIRISYKYLNILWFTLMILLVLLLIKVIQPSDVDGSAYVYLILITLVGLCSLAFNLLLASPDDKQKDKQKEKQSLHETDDTEEQVSERKDGSEKINNEEWVEKVLKTTKKDSLLNFSESLLRALSKEFEVVQGLYFSLDKASGNFKKIADFAYYSEIPPREFAAGETISGQVAKNQRVMKLKDIPEGYITVLSGLGSASPSNLLIIPVLNEVETIGVVELAFFKEPTDKEMQFFEELANKSGILAGKFLTEKLSDKS